MDNQRRQERLLAKILKGQERIMADLSTLTAALEEVRASSEVASAAVLAALDGASAQLADLQSQIDALVADQVSQEQIDALTQTAADADAIIDSITAAVTPVEPEV